MLAAVTLVTGLAFAAEGVEASFPSSPPLSIDDTETVEKGHVEINLTAGFSGNGISWESETPLIDGNYGVTDNIHVNAEIPFVVGADDGQRSSGLGNAAVAVKLRVLHKERVQLAFHPAVEFPSLPVGAYDEGGSLSLTVPVVMDVALGQRETGLGVQLARTFTKGLADDSWSAAVGLAHPLGETGDLMFDVTVEADSHLALGESWTEVGYVRGDLFGKEWLTLLSAAGLSTQHNASALLGVQLGL